MNEKISILISNYNNGKFLNRCINSCLRQNYLNKEIIIADDRSTDNSVNILKSYAKYKNIKIIFNKKKISKYPALNQFNVLIKAFELSKGEILCLLDSDDFFEKNKLKEIEKYFRKNIKIEFVQDIPYFYYSKYKKIIKYLAKSNFSVFPAFYPTSSMCFKRNFFQRFILDSSPKNYPLIEIDARIAVYANHMYSKVPNIKKNLTNYYQNNFGINSNNTKFSLNWWIKRNQMHDFMKFFYAKKKNRFYLSFDYLFTKAINFLLKIARIEYKNIFMLK